MADVALTAGTENMPKKRGSYKQYNPKQIERFIRLLQEEGLKVPAAAEKCGIPRSTAYELKKESNNSGGTILPGFKEKKYNRKGNPTLMEEHSKFLADFIDDNPSVTLQLAQDELCKKFDGLKITPSGLRKHMTDKLALSLKKADPYRAERNSERIIDAGERAVRKWIEEGVDFLQNCVFMDEAGFNLQMTRSRAWSKKGTPAKVTVPTQKGTNVSIVGCISPFGTINLSKVEPMKAETLLYSCTN